MTKEIIEQIAQIVKECGSYSVELDGYVVNPMTVACKLYNAGFLKVKRYEPKVLSEEEQKKVREVIDYSPFKNGKITNQELKRWLERYHEALLQAQLDSLPGLYVKE